VAQSRDGGAMAELSVGLLAAVGVPDRYEQLRPHRVPDSMILRKRGRRGRGGL